MPTAECVSPLVGLIPEWVTVTLLQWALLAVGGIFIGPILTLFVSITAQTVGYACLAITAEKKHFCVVANCLIALAFNIRQVRAGCYIAAGFVQVPKSWVISSTKYFSIIEGMV